MPIVDEKAPREADFDALLDLLRPLDADCAAVFNCQERIFRNFFLFRIISQISDLTADGEGTHNHGDDRRMPGSGRRS